MEFYPPTCDVFLSGMLSVLLIAFCLQTINAQCPIANGQCPDEAIQFYLYTEDTGLDSPVKVADNDSTSVAQAPFLPSPCLLVHLHGTGGNFSDPLTISVIREYVASNCNVISVDYTKYSKRECYTIRGMSVPGLGACVARFIGLLYSGADTEFSPDSTHLIGFSYGAQVAASVGHLLQANYPPVAQITGLDPGGPLLEDYPQNQVLDPTDAACVLVLHTSKVLGTVINCGHTDYYMYRGVSQPGCGQDAVCSHQKSVEYWSDLAGGRAELRGRKCRPRPLSPLFYGIEHASPEPLCPQLGQTPPIKLPLTCLPGYQSFNAEMVYA